MELTIRTIVVMIILLVGTLVFTSVIMGWNQNLDTWFRDMSTSLGNMAIGE